MKAALSLLVAAAPIVAPLGSFAQPANGPVTRAEVVAQLSQLELVGYERFKSAYPDDMQAAEARVAEATGAGMGARRVERYRAVAACVCTSMPPGESRRITSTAFALAHTAPRRPRCCCRASVIPRTPHHRAAADVPLAPLPGHARPILSISDLAAPVAIAASTPEVCHVPSAA
ncbi:hypothetical protein FEP07_03315 [Burkholderia multivorans]|nr:hypothetical protein [Burkholderia multivorans]MDR9270257.1 hypothetical protein [Burkholderia multivorans]MDR9287175.1 hypothetical protein [Burkholderia multivorans]MDR9291966.1 hypothetical protein [Burkholderia multivorans]MDR9312173.1 hypothetical protein [Burkholderia multivorans]